MTKSEPQDADRKPAAEDTDLDELMLHAFGTTVDETYVKPDDEEDDKGAKAETKAKATESDDDDESDDDNDDESDDESDDDDDDEEDSGEDKDEESETPAGDGESTPPGDGVAGEGADESLSDGQLALDLMVTERLRSFKPDGDDWVEPKGLREKLEQAALAELSDEFEEDVAAKLAKSQASVTIASLKQDHDEKKESRAAARREAAVQSLTSQVERLAALHGDELKRVDKRMARIYAEKVQQFGELAAMSIPVEVYFRLAGGKGAAPTKTGTSKAGVASRQAKAQKRGAVRAQVDPSQVGRVRTGTKKRKDEDASLIEETNAVLLSHKAVEDLLFG